MFTRPLDLDSLLAELARGPARRRRADGGRDRRRPRPDRPAARKRLAASGHAVFGLIRNPDQEDDLHATDVEPVVCDLEAGADVGAAVSGADAVVFAAGAGPGSSAERKRTMDFEGAVKLIEAAKAEGIRRYLMVSSMGAGRPAAARRGRRLRRVPAGQGRRRPGAAASGLEFTIVRPGGLTDDPPPAWSSSATPRPRPDPARRRRRRPPACLELPHTIGWTFDLIGGETPIEQALESL